MHARHRVVSMGQLVTVLLLSACGARTAPIVDDEPRDGSLARCDPAPEACNGIDDDCDGSIDEDLPLTALGDPVVIRSTEETTTGDCSVCDQALRAEVVSAGAELLVIWQMNFAFLEPEPNTFARRVDRRGTPIEPAWLWTERLTTMSLEAVELPGGGRALTFCERVDEEHDNDDYPSLFHIDERGRAEGELLRVSDARCLAEGARAGSTGTRALMAYAAHPGDVELAVLSAGSGTSRMPIGAGVEVTMATSADGALLSWFAPERGDPPEGFWSSQALDSLGQPRGGLRRVAVPLVERGARAPLPRPDGWWMAVAGERELSIEPLSLDGAPAGERLRVGADARARWVRGVALPDGRAVLVAERVGGDRDERRERTEVYSMGPEGELASTWSSDELGEPPWSSPTLRAIGGRVAIAYALNVGPRHANEVRLRLLSCEP